jgi:hypothetical protein
MIPLAIQMGLGAAGGVLGVRTFLSRGRTRTRALGKLPTVSVGAPAKAIGTGAPSVNWNNGAHYAQLAKMYYQRGDMVRAASNIRGAFAAAIGPKVHLPDTSSQHAIASAINDYFEYLYAGKATSTIKR